MKHKVLLLIPLFITLLSCSQQISFSELEISSPVKKQEIETDTISIGLGDIIELSAGVQLSDGTQVKEVLWSSSDEKIVTVENNGRITALSPGKAKVTVSAKQDLTKSTSINIVVTPPKETQITSDSGIINSFTPDVLIPIQSSSPKSSNTGEKTTLIGKVFSIDGNPLEDVIVKGFSLDKTIKWSNESQKTINGIFTFKDVPENILIKITATKTGWTERNRIEVIKGKNEINFGGSNVDFIYSLQDEPEIRQFNINSKKISSPGTIYSELNLNTPPENSETPAISLSKINLLQLDIIFSESLDKESFEKSIQLISQKLKNLGDKPVIKDKDTETLNFVWSENDTRVKVNFPLVLSNEAKTMFRIQFKTTFSDKTGKKSIKHKYIRPEDSQILFDYVLFSVTQ